VKFEIKFKPLLLEIGPEREKLYRKIQGEIERCENIINSPRTDVEERLKAMGRLANLIKIAGDILEAIQLDEIERQLKELEEDVEARKDQPQPWETKRKPFPWEKDEDEKT